MSNNFITLEALAPVMSCGKPYYIEYITNEVVDFMDSRLYICDNIEEIKNAIIEKKEIL